MADPVLTKFVAMTDWLSPRMFIIGIFNIVLALAARYFAPSLDVFSYAVAGASGLVSLPILMRHTFGAKGLRSIEQRGFHQVRDAAGYAFSFKGYDGKLLAVAICALLVFLLDGRVQRDPSASSTLAFAAFWVAGIAGHYTRVWPNDEP